LIVTQPKTYEVNFDGLVGPTHNFSGLSYGNIASNLNQKGDSNPKQAALQGLEKMRFLTTLGIKQAVLPPHERPLLPMLRALGYKGNDAGIVKRVFDENPELLFQCASSSFMWTANAATVCPSSDSLDRRLHFTPANLTSKFHRSIEAETTSKILQAIFHDPVLFTHHAPLPSGGGIFADEGAANHTRFCPSFEEAGVQLFVYGRFSLKDNVLSPRKFPARQTHEASAAIARLHQLYPERTVFAQQSPRAIDAGVFHNDVISVGCRNVFLYHEHAFLGTESVVEGIRHALLATSNTDLISLCVTDQQVSLEEAVNTYLFNSQLVEMEDGSMSLIAPQECEESPQVKSYLDSILQDTNNPIATVHYMNLNESMRNGGGPACLRLRVVMNPLEQEAIHPHIFLTDRLYHRLKQWIHTHYRDRLTIKDLADPELLKSSHEALNELTQILNLGSIYAFQR
jgi:succinylarginine dihydrolase